MNLRIPMRRNVKFRNAILRFCCITDTYAIENWFSTNTGYDGYNCAHIFYCTRSNVTSRSGIETESDGTNEWLDFSRQEGVPLSIT